LIILTRCTHGQEVYPNKRYVANCTAKTKKSKMKQLILLILLPTIISCSPKDQKISENMTIKSVFDSAEIRDLEKILMFFETQICQNENVSTENVQNCYQSFFIRMEKAEEIGSIDLKISFESQLKLYKEIDSATFNQIWTFNQSWKKNSLDTLKSITYNCNGKFVRFLETFAKEDEVVKEYYNSFQLAGDIGPTMVARLRKLHKDYDTHDIRIRLLIAIHYLTLNDQYHRIEKY